MKNFPIFAYGFDCVTGCSLLLILLLTFSGGEQAACGFAISRHVFMKGDNPDDPLVEVGGSCVRRAASDVPHTPECKRDKSPVAAPRLRIVSYNIRWRSGDELQQITRLLKDDAEIGGAGIIGLQEVDRKRKRSGHTNTPREIADALGMNYAWAAPPLAERETKEEREEETGVAILSSYPLTDVVKILLPHEGPGGRRRVAIGATAHAGAARLRVYSVHAETRVSVDERTDQLKSVLDDLGRYSKAMPAIVLGDFNTWQPDSKRDLIQLFTAANFATPFPPGQPTFRHPIVKMRLDWIWLRGMTPATSYGIARHVKISDHYPLWLEVPAGSNK